MWNVHNPFCAVRPQWAGPFELAYAITNVCAFLGRASAGRGELLPVVGAKTIQEKGPRALEGKTLPEHSSSLAPILLALLHIFQVFCIWEVW